MLFKDARLCVLAALNRNKKKKQIQLSPCDPHETLFVFSYLASTEAQHCIIAVYEIIKFSSCFSNAAARRTYAWFTIQIQEKQREYVNEENIFEEKHIQRQTRI